VGPPEPYSEFFDIQWHSPDPLLKGQLLLPFLGSDYGEALQSGTLTLHFDARRGIPCRALRTPLPDLPSGLRTILGNAAPETPGRRFSALSYQTMPTRAAWLKHALAERATEGDVLQAIEQRLAGFDRRHRKVSTACINCWNARATAWPVGAPRRMTSTGGAFSTSTNSAACASSARRCSKPPTARFSS
jgi:maltooligosyltrehalose synthase